MSKKLNSNLNIAKVKKDDEFYTFLSDIENELKFYKDQFLNKVILMPCDDPELISNLPIGNYPEDRASKFWVYFHKNFKHLGIKKIIATHYNENSTSYAIEYNGKGNDNDILEFKKIDLTDDGDFRSKEVQKIYKQADIIITNPPFSLFIPFLKNLIELNKKFLIIASETKSTSKNVFKYFKENKVWFGYTSVKQFIYCDKERKTTEVKKFGNIAWMTNMNVTKRNEEIILLKKYSKEEYPKFENIDAISVDKINLIPNDYWELMGVPSSFLKKYNPNQFEILDIDENFKENLYPGKRAYLFGKKKYARIIIRRIK
ncbi:adenine-specific methyltransferase EcoRI family protein [Spiroplasma endosymbiont of Acasis viretata]|uniref:adenine-specific methyltransferase EcoRI family protein n=1 Tax=Spiroplasma endosymbiont of Acasis viretata TaxID=3066306 RepID=UPI00313E0103